MSDSASSSGASAASSEISSVQSVQSTVFSENTHEHWLLSLKHAIFLLFCDINNNGKSQHPKVQLVLRIMEFLQLLSLGFVAWYNQWGAVDSKALKYFGHLWNLGIWNASYKNSIILLSFAMFYLLLLAGLGGRLTAMFLEGEERKSKKSVIFHYLLQMYSFMFLPILSLCVSFLNCNAESGKHLAVFADVDCIGTTNSIMGTLAAITLLASITIAGLISILFFPWNPQPNNYVATVNGRLWFLMFAGKTLLGLSASFFFGHSIGVGRTLVHSLILLLTFGCLFGWTVYTFPFYCFQTNLVAAGLFSVGLTTAILRLVSVAIPESFAPFIVLMVLIPPSLIGSVYFAKRRLLKLGTAISVVDKTEQDQQSVSHYNNEFEVEISTRFAYFQFDESDIDVVTMNYLNAADQFPQSVAVRVAHAIFLLPYQEELQLLSVVINRAKRSYFSVNNWDYEYLLFCLDKARKQQLNKIDGGVEEIQRKIRQAMKYQEECTKCIRAFWMQLMKEQDLGGLTDIVAQIERNEIRAEAIYKKLLVRFPKNTRVLRAYGLFLEEIKNDIEMAQMAYRNADEVEEEKARHHKRNFKRKKKAQDSKQDHPMVPLHDNFLHSSEEEDNKLETNTAEWESDKDQKQKLNISHRKRLEQIKQKKYKQNIEKSKSTALRKLSIAVLVTIAVLFIDLMVLYVGTRITMTDFQNSLYRVSDVAETRTLCQRIVLNARQAQIAARENRLNDTEFRKQKVHDDALSLRTIIQDKIMDKYGNKKIEHFWLDSNFNQSSYIPTTDPNNVTRIYKEVSLIDISLKFVGYSLFVAGMNSTDFVTARTNVPFRFVVDNGLHTILNGYIKAAQLETERMESYGYQFHLTLSILLGISIAILIGVVVIFFVPALQKIREERAKALRLFLAIPKSTIASIYDSLSTKEDEVKDFEEEQYQEQMAVFATDIQTQSGGIPIIRKLILRYSLSVFLVLILVSALFAIPVSFVVRYYALGAELNYTGARSYLADRMVMLGWELIHNGNITWSGGRSEVRYYMNETGNLLSLYDNAVQVGNRDLHMRDVANVNSELRDITFNDPCVLYGKDADCFGTQSLVKFFLRDAELLANQLDSQLIYNNTVMVGIAGLNVQLSPLLEKFLQAFQSYAFDLIYNVVTAESIIYAISFPVLLVCYLSLRPLEKRVKEENMRTMKMLLMIPNDVIDQVEEIKTYLDSGLKGDVSDRKVNQILQDKLERSKKIIDASTDAIVVINDQGIIEVFNPAAERLFGYSFTEVLNQNVSILMPQEVALVHQGYLDRYRTTGKARVMGTTMQQTAKTKNGTLIPVSLSLSETSVGVGKHLYAAFFKDITAQKEYEKELLKEREHSEQLLCSLLPSSIAKQLKEEMKTSGSEGVLIAEAYKEVTVLFADIVGFTTLSGKIRPTELVQLLNRLFSKWDALAGKYGVEKIKTIGDCYMAASGVPLRSLDHASNMLEFAMEMLTSLEELNKEMKYHLQCRIGLNSGPVVAGVIGTKKMAFDLWGDAVNVASRMESTGVPGRIQVSQTTFELLKEEYMFEERGRQEVKGKGIMLTYLYKERKYERTASGHKIRRQTFTPMKLQSCERNVSGTFEMVIKRDNKATSEEEMREIQILDKPIVEITPSDDDMDQILGATDLSLSSSEDTSADLGAEQPSPVGSEQQPPTVPLMANSVGSSKNGKEKKAKAAPKTLTKSRSQDLAKSRKVNFK